MAERAICCEIPGVRVSVAGDAITPAGSPLTETLIAPENPLKAVAVSVTCCALPPAVTFSVATLAENEKSGVAFVDEPPLQPILNPTANSIANQQNCTRLTVDMTMDALQ
jgi:hypothetical protein